MEYIYTLSVLFAKDINPRALMPKSSPKDYPAPKFYSMNSGEVIKNYNMYLNIVE